MSDRLDREPLRDRQEVGSSDSSGVETPRNCDSFHCTLTVIVPVYNEEATLAEQLQRVDGSFPDKEVIVVDDGSTDGSAAILSSWKTRKGFLIVRHSVNTGKGAAIRSALPYARGRFTIIQDADMENDPQDYDRLIQPLLANQAEVVYGSRYLQATGGQAHWTLFRLGVSVLNFAVRLLYGVRLTDEATCYKVLPTSQLRRMKLECQRFEFCPEVTAKACRLGLRILEVPIKYTPRGTLGGKKLRLVDGWHALVTLWKWRSWVEAAAMDPERLDDAPPTDEIARPTQAAAR
jgi:Glycosyl transferase family 2